MRAEGMEMQGAMQTQVAVMDRLAKQVQHLAEEQEVSAARLREGAVAQAATAMTVSQVSLINRPTRPSV